MAVNPNLSIARLSAGAVPVHFQKSLSSRLLLVAYAFLAPLGTLPILIGSRTYSAEYFFAILCVLVALWDLAISRVKPAKCSGLFVFGLVLWLGANVLSMACNLNDGSLTLLFRMVLKALFGYLAFVLLMSSGRLRALLIAYVAGCLVASLFTISYSLAVGSLEVIRQTTFVERSGTFGYAVNLYQGIARQGAGNLLPLWICIVLFVGTRSRSARTVLLALIPYLAVLAMLALRREVLIEGAVGFLVLLFFMPGRYRVYAGVLALIVGCAMVVVVTKSERWQERLYVETREQLGKGTDPRLVLLRNTPDKMMQSPLVGHGPGSYRWTMLEYFPRDPRLAESGIAPHNAFSRAAVETGIIGLLGLVVMVFAMGWRGCFRRSTGTLSGITLRLAAIMIFMHVGKWMFFGEGIGMNQTWYFIGVLLYLDQRLLQEGTKAWRHVRQIRPRRA